MIYTKMNQKAFIQIPLLIVILSSVILASLVITEGILIKQRKSELTADISEPFKQEQAVSPSPSAELIQEEPKQKTKSSSTGASTQRSLIDQEPIPETSPIPIQSPATPSPLPSQLPIVIAPSPIQQNQQTEDIQRQIDQLNSEQIRQTKCIEANNLEKQIQTLCHAYNFPGVDRCIEIRQKDVQLLKDYVPNDEQRKDGQDESYYAGRIREEQDKIDQMIALKPQYLSAKTECGQ